ncbi:AAA family ATPase [Lacrimispora celerecrescens]|uniref:AAA family ATPase n=1 Tax=Lacrimispora celerecrescens TaxID=29354 RepID=UPI0016473C2C|nr:AAA family ATPase [Lacrimispora celerecrescens]
MEDKHKILELLNRKRNVLLMGAPGTGKSKVMNDVARAFEDGGSKLKQPSHVHGASIPIPAIAMPNGLELPMLQKKNRKVFRTTLHQNSKYRDFLTGIVPEFGSVGGYKINEGILYRANEFAKQADSAALLIIDELNRGPAIEVFGGSIVAIENDKRLGEDNSVLPTTQFFEIIDPVSGGMIEYAFSPNLYILSAMNQADASVAPLDVAFMRRWQSYKLEPNYEVLYNVFNMIPSSVLPTVFNDASDVYHVAFRALEKINTLIAIGRGSEYQLGQGVFLSTKPKDDSKDAALQFVLEAWAIIYSHIEELFFGDGISIGYIINASSPLSPYELVEVSFAGETKVILKSNSITTNNIFDLYYSIAGREQ